MQALTIRKVRSADLPALARLARETFHTAFAGTCSPETMEKYLNEQFSDDALAKQLAQPGSEFHVAAAGNELVAYLKINIGDAQTELQGENAMEIERIYVKQQFHGKGVAQPLFEVAMKKALDLGVRFIWLGVWEGNIRAVKFYEKQGFQAFGEHFFDMGAEKQVDMLMKLELQE